MNIEIKLLDPSLPLPSYQTLGSVAFDLYSRITLTIKTWIPTIIPTNLIVNIPKGYMLMLVARSSLPLKKGLMVANGIGVIDQDYHGEKDEIGFQVINFTDKEITVERGERIGQALLVKIVTVEKFITVDIMSGKSRGGFGSTGK